MKRRQFLKTITLTGVSAWMAESSVKAKSIARETFRSKDGFTLWQLPSQVNTIGNSYVILTNKGRVFVMDGGMPDEAFYLRGFLSALGKEVEGWFISHPHVDHMGALKEILKDPKGIRIRHIYHSRFSESLIDSEKGSAPHTRELYALMDKGDIAVTDFRESGHEYTFDGMHVKILGITNEEFRNNPYNNSSTIIRVWDKKKSIVFLGDAGVECGNKVLGGTYRQELNCDYLQMAHHGQQGCSKDFYKSIRFHACLWPTPLWVWNNDQGKGFNTGILKTVETRSWMDEIGIKEHHVSCVDGLWRLA